MTLYNFFSGDDIVINFFLNVSSHFTALDLYGKRILNNLVISLSLISQAQGIRTGKTLKTVHLHPQLF